MYKASPLPRKFVNALTSGDKYTSSLLHIERGKQQSAFTWSDRHHQSNAGSKLKRQAPCDEQSDVQKFNVSAFWYDISHSGSDQTKNKKCFLSQWIAELPLKDLQRRSLISVTQEYWAQIESIKLPYTIFSHLLCHIYDVVGGKSSGYAATRRGWRPCAARTCDLAELNQLGWCDYLQVWWQGSM